MKAARKLGTDMGKYYDGNKTWGILKEGTIMIGLAFLSAIPATIKMILPSYYKENWKMDVLRKANKRWGFIQYLLYF